MWRVRELTNRSSLSALKARFVPREDERLSNRLFTSYA
jgi:hypothetical protein